jgi:hypothetical protein
MENNIQSNLVRRCLKVNKEKRTTNMERCGFVMMKLMRVSQFQKQILFLKVGEKEDFASKMPL